MAANANAARGGRKAKRYARMAASDEDAAELGACEESPRALLSDHEERRDCRLFALSVCGLLASLVMLVLVLRVLLAKQLAVANGGDSSVSLLDELRPPSTSTPPPPAEPPAALPLPLHSAAPPPPLLPLPPLLRPPRCAWAHGMINLRDLDPPVWCISRSEDESDCIRSYVYFTDSGGLDQYSRCEYAHGKCVAAAANVACPRPPSSPPPPPSPSPPPPPRPPPPRPPWTVPTVKVVDVINSRFSGGHASSDLASAGVLVRVFDDLTDPERPWLPCPRDKPWLAGCARFSDHFSASLVWPGHTEVYTTGRGGFVLRPTAVRQVCFYHMDGTTMSKAGNPCPEFCTSPGARMWRCAWPPPQMQQGMNIQRGEDHNEIILDAATWVHNLPHTIEAVFTIPTNDPRSKEEARRVHQKYLRDTGLRVEDVPFLLYDKTKTIPFTELR